jgi:hypothetical protein
MYDDFTTAAADAEDLSAPAWVPGPAASLYRGVRARLEMLSPASILAALGSPSGPLVQPQPRQQQQQQQHREQRSPAARSTTRRARPGDGGACEKPTPPPPPPPPPYRHLSRQQLWALCGELQQRLDHQQQALAATQQLLAEHARTLQAVREDAVRDVAIPASAARRRSSAAPGVAAAAAAAASTPARGPAAGSAGRTDALRTPAADGARAVFGTPPRSPLTGLRLALLRYFPAAARFPAAAASVVALAVLLAMLSVGRRR